MINQLISLGSAIFIIGLMSFAARAEIEAISGLRMHAADGDGGCLALIHVHNLAGVYNNTETVETAVGTARVKYETIGGHNAEDADIVTVETLPPGILAEPMRMELPDGNVGDICLYAQAIS